MAATHQPKIIVHGGAGAWKDRSESLVLAGVREAAAAGWKILRDGGSCLDAAEQAAILLEDNPQYDAGVGSYLNAQGEVEMDALITDGATRRFGAVAAVQHIKNPIALARLVMTRTPHAFFVGDGAEQLAISFGIPWVPNLTFVTVDEYANFQMRVNHPGTPIPPGKGTIGVVARDQAGHIASATSTGGTAFKQKGRVGDTPIYGAGGYADDAYGGASATGVGENIMRFFLSKRAVDDIAAGMDANAAAQSAVAYLASRVEAPEVGVIVIDANGRVGAAHTTAAMPIAWVTEGGDIQAAMRGPYAMG